MEDINYLLEMLYVGILGGCFCIPLSLVLIKYRNNKEIRPIITAGLSTIAVMVMAFEILWLYNYFNSI